VATGPLAGQAVEVKVPTHISGLLEFESGAAVTITTSFDVWKHQHPHIELYGQTGSMVIADPNQFQGEILVSDRRGDWKAVPQAHGYGDSNYRILGLAEMALAIRDGRPHRASLPLALHVLEVMEGIVASAEAGRRITMTHGCDRPAALDPSAPFGWPS
jgi:predicted dehydrogenase